MKLSLKQKEPISYVDNIDQVDQYILESFSKGDFIVFKKIKFARNREKLITYYIKKIRTLEDVHEVEKVLIFQEESLFNLAKKIYIKLHPKKLKIGLALSGGGARGAYQTGVMKVLEENGLLEHIDMIVGTSIGAFSMVYYVSHGVKGCRSLWKDMDTKVVLTKNSIPNAFKKGALYSREETKEFLKDSIDIEKINNSETKLFLQAYSLSSVSLKQVNVNKLSKERLIDYMLASSAIPGIFGVAKIGGEVFADAGMLDNNGVSFLIEKGCNVILYLSLQREENVKTKAQTGVSIIDWGSCHFYSGLIKGIVDFSTERNTYKMEYGEEIAKLMIEKLKHKGFLDIIKEEKVEKFYKLDEYLRLSKEENTIKFAF